MKALRSILAAVGRGSHWQWLVPGVGIKRWLVLLLVGATLTALGIGYLLLELYRTVNVPPLISALTLQYIPRLGRAALFGVVGVMVMVFAVIRLNRTLLAPFVRPGQSVVEAVSDYGRRGRGPKIVALGGGTGLAVLLRGLKVHTANLTAIVTVADDGGSSGRLRRSLGVLPPGDFRNCLAALADDEALVTHLFQYRFGSDDKDLGGHSFGNLFITALAATAGSFERALVEASRVLAIRGQVLPSTLRDVTLMGELVDETAQVSLVAGESQIPIRPGTIRRVYLEPGDAPAYPGAIRAILEADLIVLGPGSLYTSLLPNLLVRDLAEAVRASRALKVYVCNTATQPGETDGYTVRDHVRAIERHTGAGLFSVVLANVERRGHLRPNLSWVAIEPGLEAGPRLVTTELTDETCPWRHDARRLAQALMALLAEYRGGS